MLLAVIFMLAILIISLSIAVPKIAREIQRDRELETIERGKQYARAVKMYYKKFANYPPNMEALTQTSGIRFLRKKYKDPTGGGLDWRPIQFGQNKAPTVMGFFGQPLAGSTMAGMSAGGGNGIAGASTIGGPAVGGTGDSTSSTTDPSTTGSGTALGTTTGNLTGATGTTGSTNPTGPTFGGAGIIGFSPNSPKQSILVYKKKNHYNEWEFVYDPMADRMIMPGTQPIQPGAPGAPGALAPTTPLSSPQ